MSNASCRIGPALLAACVIVSGAALPANAADVFRIPSLSYASDGELGPYNRTGFILSPDFEISEDISLGGTAGVVLDDPEGFSIGGKVGYDQQIGNFVVGVLTDAFYSFADSDGTRIGANVFETELNYYGTVRGRLGYSFGRFMAYGTAGYAYGDFEVTNISTGASSSQLLSGWTYGGGVEYAWNRDLNLHAGYRRIDFDEETFGVLPAGRNTISPEIDVLDFGLTTRY